MGDIALLYTCDILLGLDVAEEFKVYYWLNSC